LTTETRLTAGMCTLSREFQSLLGTHQLKLPGLVNPLDCKWWWSLEQESLSLILNTLLEDSMLF